MHKKVECPHCEGKGYTYIPQMSGTTSFNRAVVYRKVVCPTCRGAKFYLKPVLNRDIISNMKYCDIIDVMSKLAVDAMTESLVTCHGAVLNQSQKDNILATLKDRIAIFMDSPFDISDNGWDLDRINFEGYALSQNDIIKMRRHD